MQKHIHHTRAHTHHHIGNDLLGVNCGHSYLNVNKCSSCRSLLCVNVEEPDPPIALRLEKTSSFNRYIQLCIQFRFHSILLLCYACKLFIPNLCPHFSSENIFQKPHFEVCVCVFFGINPKWAKSEISLKAFSLNCKLL